MKTQTSSFRIRIGRLGSRRGHRSPNQRGIALVTTLLLLILVSLLGLAMALTTNSDMLINSYYGSYRGSFYAADSGLNIARAALVSQLTGAVNMTACTGWVSGNPGSGCTSAPLNGTTAASNAYTYLTSTYGSFSSLNAGQAANSWHANFMVANTATCPTSVTPNTTGYPQTTLNSQGQISTYVYRFDYYLCAVGQTKSPQQVYTEEKGSLLITIQAQGPTVKQVNTSFAAFGAFIDQFTPCLGPLVYGTMTGPFFTNGAWNFGSGGSYIYTDPVGQANADASFWIGNTCYNSASSSYSKNGTTVAPNFEAGFNLGQTAVPMPANDFVQQWAVIDGIGCGEGGTTCGVSPPPYPTNAQLNAALMNINGVAYPTAGTSSGVYLPYCTTACTTGETPDTIYGGGIFVEGDASVQLSVGTDSHNNPTQVITITQSTSGGCGSRWGGSCGGGGGGGWGGGGWGGGGGGWGGGGGGGGTTTTTTITIDNTANTTTVVSGTTTLNLTGVPENKTGSTPQPGIMVYVDGTIGLNGTGLQGPGQGQAGIQNGYAMTISGGSDIDITGDLVYKSEPVTLNSSDTLIPANNYGQVLGVFTANGNIVLSSPYGNGNLETDASLAAINGCSATGTCSLGSSSYGFATNGNINTWNIVGGRIESYAHGVNISTGNTYFDRRFLNGLAPPWFPSTTVNQLDLTATPSAPKVTPTTQRLTWVTWPQ